MLFLYQKGTYLHLTSQCRSLVNLDDPAHQHRWSDLHRPFFDPRRLVKLSGNAPISPFPPEAEIFGRLQTLIHSFSLNFGV